MGQSTGRRQTAPALQDERLTHGGTWVLTQHTATHFWLVKLEVKQ